MTADDRDHPHRSPSDKGTYERALLLMAIEQHVFDPGTKLVHRIVHELQDIGVDYGMQFKTVDGEPYSARLHQALLAMQRAELMTGYDSSDAMAITDHGREMIWMEIESRDQVRANGHLAEIRQRLSKIPMSPP